MINKRKKIINISIERLARKLGEKNLIKVKGKIGKSNLKPGERS